MKRSGGDVVDRAAAVWRGLAPRERLLAAVLAMVGLTAATLTAMDWSGRTHDAWALAVADGDLQRQTAAREAGRLDGAALRDLDRISTGALSAGDIWIARIRLEQRLVSAAGAAGLASPRVSIESVDEAAPTPTALTAGLEATYDGGALVRFLESLDAEVGLGVVQEMSVDRETGEVSLQLAFPVIIDAEPTS